MTQAQPVDCVPVAATDPLNLVGILTPGARLPAVVGNAVLYEDGIPLAIREAGEVSLRGTLADGAQVDEQLRYHEPPPRVVHNPQFALPLLSN